MINAEGCLKNVYNQAMYLVVRINNYVSYRIHASVAMDKKNGSAMNNYTVKAFISLL